LAQAGEINHKAIAIKNFGLEPESEAAVVAVQKTAMASVAPLAVAAGEIFKALAAGMGRR
jgi:hypothetical protein